MEAPSRTNMPMDFIEGWGLYVEGLGLRMGLYSDPYSLFGHYFVGNKEHYLENPLNQNPINP